MTIEQFNAALTRCIDAEANKQSPCYPLVGVGGDATDFGAWDNDRQILLSGVFSEVINQDAIDRAIALTASAMTERSDVDVIPCVIAPHDAPLFASSEDVLLYYVVIQSGGMLAGMLEFTDYEEVYWDDDEAIE